MTSTRDASVDELAESLREGVGRFVRAIRHQTGTVTTAQDEALAHLERSGPTSIAALAQARGVKHQSMRLMAARLQEAGLLTMAPDPDDGRGYRMALTPAGRARLKQARRARTVFLADRLARRLDAEERALLDRAVGLLDRLGASGTTDA